MSRELNNKAKRIIENVFDVLMETDFKDQARSELRRDLASNNVSVDKDKGTITIENLEGTMPLYEVKISKL